MGWTFEEFQQKVEDKKNQIRQGLFNISNEDMDKIGKARNIIEAVNQNVKSERLLEVLCELDSWLICSRRGQANEHKR
jgi:hypothetical protein